MLSEKRKAQKRASYRRHKAAYIARATAWRKAHPEQCAQYAKTWRANNPKRAAFIEHRGNATRRGIEFQFTFEDWTEWWGEDFNKQGLGRDDLCMCRNGDEGAYELGNIYKATRSQNADDALRKRWGT